MITRLNKLFRRARQTSAPSKETHRPTLFTLLFWCTAVATYASYLYRHLAVEEQRFGVVAVTLTVCALAAAWVVLPWDPRVSLRRKLTVLTFLAATFVVGCLASMSWTLVFYLVAVANGVFLFGFGRGIAYAVALLPVFFANFYLNLVVRGFMEEEAIEVAALGTITLAPVSAFMVGICSVVVEAIRRREEAQALLAKLESANAELERRAERSRELAVSEERTRMARDVHDSVGHHLSVINLQLENARRLKERRPEKAWDQVETAKRFALEALSEVRRSVRALKPLALEERSGTGALLALIRSFEGTGMEVRFELTGEERGLPEEVELALYRAMQEGLTNALRHSGARRVTASLVFEEERVELTVIDDGKGATQGGNLVEALDEGFGLKALKERAESLGGVVSAGAAQGDGFVLRVGLPTGGSAPREVVT